MRADVLQFLEDVPRRQGDVAALRLAWYPALLLSHPQHVEQVLLTDHQKFEKPARFRRIVRHVCGSGLFANDGDDWRRQRRRVQSALHDIPREQYCRTVVRAIEHLLRQWPDDDRQDLFGRMVELALAIRTRTTFGMESAEDFETLGQAIRVFMEFFVATFRNPLSWPLWVPTRGNLRIRAAMRDWWRVMDGAVERVRRVPGDESHVIGSLLTLAEKGADSASDGSEAAKGGPLSGARMSDRQLRDELATWVLTGTETLANTLSWIWYLLALHPQVRARMAEEARNVLGGRPPQFDDLPRLVYTQCVIDESMRLYPQAYIMGRKSLVPFSVGGYDFPARTAVFLNQWAIGRDPRWWDRPLEFLPERWSDELRERLPRFAYFPYGVGPRTCAGRNFARLELPLVLATIVQQFEFELSPACRVRPLATLTLRPDPAIPARFIRRKGT